MNTNRKIGTLMLVEVNKQQLGIKNIVKVKDIKHLYVTGDIFNQLKPDIDGLIYMNNKASNLKTNLNNIEIVYQPIIICDDEIKDNDNIIWGNMITKAGKEGIKNFDEIKNDLKKILALPNQFSQEFLQAICDGKVKDGDKVEVEMTATNDLEGIPFKQWDGEFNVVKLRKDGTAIIHPYVESVKKAAWKQSLQYYDQERRGFYKGFLAAIEWQKNQKK